MQHWLRLYLNIWETIVAFFRDGQGGFDLTVTVSHSSLNLIGLVNSFEDLFQSILHPQNGK